MSVDECEACERLEKVTWRASFEVNLSAMIGRNDDRKFREPEQRGQREGKARRGSVCGKEMTHSSA